MADSTASVIDQSNREAEERAQGKRICGDPKATLWDESRSGSHAGRGFHYQDRIATELALEQLIGGSLREVIPEGLEDISIETSSGPIHIQAKSRRENRGEFRSSDLRGVFANLAKRLIADPGSSVALVLERPVADWPRLADAGRDGQASVSGTDQALAAQILPLVRSDLAGMEMKVDDFLAYLTIEMRDGQPDQRLRLLADRLALPPASCQAHYFAVQDVLATLADENGERIRPLRSAATQAAPRDRARATWRAGCPRSSSAAGGRTAAR